eukprot:CAMPEP_0183727338 /NCGR_PEP_ID=MMETSP0737-20130205/25443_1 /TAXON_ID=385413 /ORGANISM="Thalassiosira miniscula, Strain CCMP1093" /LENGTH=386 /DNA_ID=CAMNT_0025958941 /DNA_START=114 /DNA_END=1271 /DNA_ORIENTATION=+
MVSRKILNESLRQFLILILVLPTSFCFAPIISHPVKSNIRTHTLPRSTTADEIDSQNDVDISIRSPMRFLGPYPTIPLRFPNLATSSQRERNVTGISLDWVLDTAANVNTINAQVAQELTLEKVGEANPGVGAAGSIMGGDTFMLGDCELDIKIDAEQSDTSDTSEDGEYESLFMKELTASALPVASPAAAGLLGLAFFFCFEGGVEFAWGDSNESPSVTFYGSSKGLNLDGMARVPFESLPVSMLPSVTLCINGKEIPALFDTGSPITVLNARAAKEAGLETAISLDDLDQKGDEGNSGWNPFSKFAANIDSAQKIAKATASGDILTIAGASGQPVRLVRSNTAEDIDIKTSMEINQYSSIGKAQVYIGDIPGLAALGGLGGEAP